MRLDAFVLGGMPDCLLQKVDKSINIIDMEEKLERNKRLLREKEEGATYRELSLKYMLSMHRVYQIVKRERGK